MNAKTETFCGITHTSVRIDNNTILTTARHEDGELINEAAKVWDKIAEVVSVNVEFVPAGTRRNRTVPAYYKLVVISH